MANEIIEVCVPDIGGGTDVDVIDIMVKVGDEIVKDQSLVTLEGDKATMDIPSPIAGIVQKIIIKLGDKVSQGALILEATSSDASEKSAPAIEAAPVKQSAPVVEPVLAPAPVVAVETKMAPLAAIESSSTS